jgi:uncharacterized small protein (DUF1192 family)
MEDEDRPKQKMAHVVGENLEMLSVEELRLRVAMLESEIGRLKSEIERKVASRSAADAFFKT